MAILLSIKVWGMLWGRQCIVVECDNRNSVLAINSGVSRDPLMQKLLRNLHLECTLKSIEVSAVFIFGRDNCRADFLSRWHLHPKFASKFWQSVGGQHMREVQIDNEFFKLLEV